MKLEHKQKLAQKRVWRVRKKVVGTAERPRLSVAFTNKHVYAQCVNDDTGLTLASVSSTSKDLRDKNFKANIESAKALGKLLGEKAKSAGITCVVLDRGSRTYHGCVQAFADAAREAGLQF